MLGKNARWNLGSASATDMSSASHHGAFPDILSTAFCSLQKTTEGKACSAQALLVGPHFHACSHHPAELRRSDPPVLDMGHATRRKGPCVISPANRATHWPWALELLQTPPEAAPSTSSAAAETRATFRTHSKFCITLQSLELSGGRSFVLWMILILLFFVSSRFEQKLKVFEIPYLKEQRCSPGRTAGSWRQTPGALGSLSETLCQELTKRFLQTSEIKNILSK